MAYNTLFRFVPMVGTQNHHIREDGQVYSTLSHSIVCDPYRTHYTFNKPYTFKDPKPFKATMPQLLMYSFYGFSPSSIEMIRDDEPIELDNLRYNFKTRDFKDDDLYIDGILYKKIVPPDNVESNASYYINEWGLVIYKQKASMYIKPLRWTFNASGYPAVSIFQNKIQMQIHRLVYTVYKGEIPSGYTVNHDDHCKWNPSIWNLSLMTQSNNTRDRHNFAKDRIADDATIRKIAKMLEADIPMKEIAEKIGYANTKERDNLLSLASRLHNRTSYAHLIKDIKVENYTGRVGTSRNEAAFRKVCELLHPDCNYTDAEIGRMTGVPPTTVRAIRCNIPEVISKDVMAIRNEYNIDSRTRENDSQYAPIFTDDQVRDMLVAYRDKTMRVKDILKKYGISDTSFYNIKNGKVVAYRDVVNEVFDNK